MKFQRYQKSLKKVWRRWQSRLLGGRRILVLGDSHCGVFEYSFDHGLLAPHLLNCEIVAGATAYGLKSDTSVSQAWQKFDRALRRFVKTDVFVIMLGECDCSFALWKKAERLRVAPETLIPDSLTGIRRLVTRIQTDSGHAGKKIILVGAILPTISDAALVIQENILRREILATQVERTHLVFRFNECLDQMAGSLGLTYIELTKQTLNPETGLVDSHFVASADDHHLSHPASAPLWSDCLLKVL